jgi:hypothetical protein
MSFSNADTGSKNADPYKAKNLDDAPVKDKAEDLVKFCTSCKFGMMTTRIAKNGLLVSRCMAIAGTVIIPASCFFISSADSEVGEWRH